MINPWTGQAGVYSPRSHGQKGVGHGIKGLKTVKTLRNRGQAGQSSQYFHRCGDTPH